MVTGFVTDTVGNANGAGRLIRGTATKHTIISACWPFWVLLGVLPSALIRSVPVGDSFPHITYRIIELVIVLLLLLDLMGQVYDKGHHPEAFIRVVSDGYFEALGIPLKLGREFTESDRASSDPVVVVNETLARTLWPGQDPVGQMMTQDGGRRVVGVVGDVRHGGPERSGGSEMYLPMRQTADYPEMELVVRTTLPPDSLAAGIRTALRPIDPNLPVTRFQTLQDLVDTAVSPRRFLVTLLAGFAGFALLLASLGIYALISYSVSQRTREIGIRMVLGASERLVQREVLLKTLRLALTGVAIGTLASFALTKWIESLLFRTTPTDPVVFSCVILLLGAAALVAGYVPARRASRIDPMVALRTS
jgi:predicted permease